MIQLLLVVILTMEDIKKAIGEAEKELEVAERLVASKRSALMASVLLLGWLTFSFRLGPTCTVHRRGKTTVNAEESDRALSDFYSSLTLAIQHLLNINHFN